MILVFRVITQQLMERCDNKQYLLELLLRNRL